MLRYVAVAKLVNGYFALLAEARDLALCFGGFACFDGVPLFGVGVAPGGDNQRQLCRALSHLRNDRRRALAAGLGPRTDDHAPGAAPSDTAAIAKQERWDAT